MTDVLEGADATLEDEMTSQQERPPKVTVDAAPAGVQCHYCSQVFEGPARWFQRGRHEKAEHHDEWEAAKAGAPKTKTKPKTASQAKPKAARTTVTPPPKAGAKRIAVADSIGRNVGRLAKMVARVDAPLGRALAFSSQATGAAADDLVAGTILDRKLIQRVAPLADRWEKLGGVLAFPVMVALISRNPAMFDLLEDDLRDATLDVIMASVPTMEKRAARERKAVDALRRLGQVDERYATTDDPIGLILRDIFAPSPTADDGPSE